MTPDSTARRQSASVAFMLVAAFLIVAGSASYCISSLLSRSNRDSIRTELIVLAKLAALEVDPNSHEALTEPSQMRGQLYRKQIERLARLQAQVPDLKYVYTLRRIHDGYAFVLDPTKPGDHNGDGFDDKSYLLDPYPEITPTAKRVFETGVADAEDEPYTDRWGAWISGYAPIVDASGKTVGVIGVDKDAAAILARRNHLAVAAWLGFLVACALGLTFSMPLSRMIARRTSGPPATPLPLVRSTVLEMLLAAVCFSVLAAGMFGFFSLSKARQASAKSVERQAILNQFRRDLAEGMLGRGFDANAREGMQKRLAAHKEAWLAAKLSGAGVLDSRAIAALALAAGVEVERESRRFQELQEEVDARTANLMAVILIAGLFSVGGLILVRSTTAHQASLVSAVREARNHQEAYRQLAESLPIGLFTYFGGEITYTNATWDQQLGREHPENAADAFKRSMSEEEWQSLLSLLAGAESAGEPFQHRYRSTSGRWLEARAVPVPDPSGRRSVLGFAVDVTDNVESERALEDTNQELATKNSELQMALSVVEENFEAMVQSLVKAVEAKDPYTAGHSERVMDYSVRIGRRMGLSTEELRVLQMGTLIHDIGKIGVPDAVLTKKEKLSPLEFQVIQEHPRIGAKMVQNIPMFAPCVPIILWHHERLDGSGYPHGIRADELATTVRIAAVADAFDAMTSTRAYRDAMPAEVAIENLRKDASAGALDHEIVELLADIVEKEGVLWKPLDEWAA